MARSGMLGAAVCGRCVEDHYEGRVYVNNVGGGIFVETV